MTQQSRILCSRALGAAARSARRHPWRWLAAVFAVLIVFPVIDVTVSAWFFEPTHRVFVARVWGPSEWIRRAMPYYLFGLAGGVLALWMRGIPLSISAPGGVNRLIGERSECAR